MSDHERRSAVPAGGSATRRGFLRLCAGTFAGLAAPAVLARSAGIPERSLSFLNLHTGEQLVATYWANGGYLRQARAEIDHLLRDHRTGDVHPIDARLLDLLFALQQRLDARQAFHVISGYRSPATNRKLRRRSGGVAKRSLHMQGRAIDVRVPGCELKRLRAAALSLRAGGVGYYPRSGFVHLDTGRFRHW